MSRVFSFLLSCRLWPPFPPHAPFTSTHVHARLEQKITEQRFFNLNAALSPNFLQFGPPLVRVPRFRLEPMVERQVTW